MFYFINTYKKGFTYDGKFYDELSDEEFKQVATISYSIEDFVWAFNHHGEISDEWYVRYII